MSILEIRVGGRFRLKKNIGQGSFGEIYIAENVQTNEEVAVKLEDVKSKYPQLIYEAKIMYSLQGGSGIPNLIWCGQEGEYNILVMELLGESIEELFNLCRKKLTLKCVLMLVDQTLALIEYTHNKGFIHRDLKPENILMGIGKKCHIAHFIDYGLAKRYREPKTGKHIPYREGKQLTGTARYASINTHNGFEQSRRDDLEALGYIYIYLFKGSLPWQGLKSESKQEKYNAIHQRKMNMPLAELCSDMPREFVTFFEYCRRLKFDEKPDYTYLRRIFKELSIRNGFEPDYVYDWMLIPISTQVSLEGNHKIAINLEVTPNDEFINYNVCNLDSKASPSVKLNTHHDLASPNNKEQDENKKVEKELGHGAAALIGKGKPKLKPIETEHLRTDYKLANIPSPSNFKSPNSQAVSAQKKPTKEKECNIF